MTYKLPEGWREVKLGEVVEYETGKLNSNASVENGKYPFFTCAPEPLRINDYKYDKEAILLAGNNAGGIFHVNRYCGKFNAYQRTYIMETKNKDVLCNDFLYYLLNINLNHFKNISSGSATKFLTRKILDKINLRLPPLQEQKAISSTLSALDDKIELNSKINKNLEDQAQTIFKHWFIDFEFPDENGNPYKSSGGEMVESELGVIPKGWEVVKLNSLIDRIDNRGKTPPYAKEKTKFPLLDVATLRGDNRIIDYNKVTKYVSEKTYNTWFRSGHPKSKDILISTVGSLAELKLFIGNIGCIAQNVVALRSKGISECYLYEYLKFIKKDLASYDIGSVQPSIKITHIINHPILVPEEKCIQRYHDICKKMTNRIYLNSLENQTLSQLRDTLLPKLMSGEIRIPLDE